MQRTVTDITPQLLQGVSKKRVAAYARVSSGKDAMPHSLASQIDYYGNYIRKNLNRQFVVVYSDGTVTGTKGNRENFDRIWHEIICNNL